MTENEVKLLGGEPRVDPYKDNSKFYEVEVNGVYFRTCDENEAFKNGGSWYFMFYAYDKYGEGYPNTKMKFDNFAIFQALLNTMTRHAKG